MRSAADIRIPVLAGILALAAGCVDHGPTNLYSDPLFGVNQPGPRLEVSGVDAESLGPPPGNHGLEVWIKNTGGGSARAPVRGVFSAGPCAALNAYGNVSATALFGFNGDVIAPGDVVRGRVVDLNGAQQSSHYAAVVAFDLTNCAGTSVQFNLALSDPDMHSWQGAFSAVAQ